MAEKTGKVINVNNLIIHAKNVEIVDSEHVKIDRAKHIEPNQEDHFQRRDPWEFFWGWQPREEANEQEGEKEHSEEAQN